MNEVIKSCLWKSIQIKWLSLCLDRSINQSIKKKLKLKSANVYKIILFSQFPLFYDAIRWYLF